jgi:coproporphyrinogen III oxidase
MKERFYGYIQNLQDAICAALENADGGATFREDLWTRPEGGGGRTRVIENGNVFEKGGVNISAVHGKLPETMRQMLGVGDVDFYACGLSLVLHPQSPMVPTVHANWRYFEMYDSAGNIIDQWFGGGQDLTPYYLFVEDAEHFHQTCKNACDRHDPGFYPKYKKQCDDYFRNAHRNEARGIGGLFFDYCKPTESRTIEQWFAFVSEVGDSFISAYLPIVEKRRQLPYTDAQRDWQEIRRGRYVEFNLVHDKGTLFGLRTNGRIESILMSLPPKVQWVYDRHPEAGSEEARLLEVLKNPVDWIAPEGFGDIKDLIGKAYAAFNARDIGTALSTFHPNVEWPKAFEGGYVHGHQGIREYWTRQWTQINPHVEPIGIVKRPDGKIEVSVGQHVEDLQHNTIFEGTVKHVYTVQDGLLRKMDIE